MTQRVPLDALATTAQAVGALLLGATLSYLARIFRRRPVAYWAAGWLSLAVATLAVDLSFVGGGRASWALYLVCEWTFGALLVLGARDLTGAPAVPLRRLAWLLVPALAAALALSRLPGNFNALFQVQAGIMAAGFFTTLAFLLRVPAAERTAGLRLLGAALLALGLLFAAYVPLYGHAETLPVLGYSSLADLALETLLGFGMVLTISSEMQRRLELDLERRQQAEELLLQQQAQFQSLIERLPLCVLVVREGRIAFANASAALMLRSQPVALQGQPLLSLVIEEERPGLAAFLRPGAGRRELHFNRTDGPQVTLEMAPPQPLSFNQEPALLLAAVDVTERRKLEAELLLSERLTSLGTLASGLAHEINNPLAYLISNLDFARTEVTRAAAASGELSSALGEAAQGADRVRQIVRDLLTLTRRQEPHQAVDLVQVVRASLRAARHSLHERARLVDECQPVPAVLGSTAELSQAVLALLLNAAQAIEPGSPDRNEIRVSTGQRGGEVLAEVRDSGAGIAAGDLPRIFDPFFTTRRVGDGMGLGLTLCHATVTALGGRIEVESVPGRGSAFRIVLPQAAA